MEGHNRTDIPEASRDVRQQARGKGQEAQGPWGGRALAPRRGWGPGSVGGEGRTGRRTLPPVPPPCVLVGSCLPTSSSHRRGLLASPARTFPSCTQRGFARQRPGSGRGQTRKTPPGRRSPPTPPRPLLSVPLSAKPPLAALPHTGSFLHQPGKSFPEPREPDVVRHTRTGAFESVALSPTGPAGSGDSPRAARGAAPQTLLAAVRRPRGRGHIRISSEALGGAEQPYPATLPRGRCRWGRPGR